MAVVGLELWTGAATGGVATVIEAAEIADIAVVAGMAAARADALGVAAASADDDDRPGDGVDEPGDVAASTQPPMETNAKLASAAFHHVLLRKPGTYLRPGTRDAHRTPSREGRWFAPGLGISTAEPLGTQCCDREVVNSRADVPPTPIPPFEQLHGGTRWRAAKTIPRSWLRWLLGLSEESTIQQSTSEPNAPVTSIPSVKRMKVV